MAGQVRIYGPNALRQQLAGPQYPEEVVLQGNSLEFFARVSALLDTLDEINGRQNELVLRREYFLDGDMHFWGLVVDLLFPYESRIQHFPSHELVYFTDDGNYYLNPTRDVTLDDLREVIDYFMIGNPRQMRQMLEYFLYARPGAPEMPAHPQMVLPPRQQLEQQRAALRAYRNAAPVNVAPNNTNWNWNGNNESNTNQGPNLGFTEEEEEALGRLQGANAARYFRGGRKTLRHKKLNRRTRKH